MKSITSFDTIEKIRDAFSQFGLPLTTYISNEFKTFLESNGIQYKLIAPYHPSTNRQVERYVQTLRQALRKTVNATSEISPSILLLKRDMRTTVDLTNSNLVDQMRQKQSPLEYNRVATFEQGQSVVVRYYTDKIRKWKFRKNVRKDGPLTHLVAVSGQLWKMHVDQIKPSMSFTIFVEEFAFHTCYLNKFFLPR